MRIEELNGKSVCILGYGKEGKAMVKAIETFAPQAEVTVADQNEEAVKELQGTRHKTQVGDTWLSHVYDFDVVIASPGISPSLISDISQLTSPTQIFFDTVEDSGAMIIGITGSKGKSTTSSLIAAILRAAKKDVHLVGNIGEPSIAHLRDANKNTIFVHELSSYQLMRLTKSPHIAVVTSFFREHLDYHGTEEAYIEAKMRITRFQKPDDIAFFPENSPGAAAIAAQGEGRKIPYGIEDAPVQLNETKFIGEHNLLNIAGACKVAKELGVSEAICIATIKTFLPLPHRLQSLGMHHELEWIDDAISTTPESTIAALDALGDRVRTIILGGQDRGSDFTELGKRIAASPIHTVILFPGSGPRIKQAIEAAQAKVTFFDADSMERAVEIAKRETKPMASEPAPIVLLSTASPSYGMFKNFEEKGEIFKKAIG